MLRVARYGLAGSSGHARSEQREARAEPSEDRKFRETGVLRHRRNRKGKVGWNAIPRGLPEPRISRDRYGCEGFGTAGWWQWRKASLGLVDRNSPPDGTGSRRERRTHEPRGFGQRATCFGVCVPPGM